MKIRRILNLLVAQIALASLLFSCFPRSAVVMAQTSGTARRLAPSTFNNLGTPTAGEVRWCTNCQATAPCTSGGTGADAFANGSNWSCAIGGGGGGGGLADPGSNGIIKRTALNVTAPAVAGTDYLLPTGSAALLTALNANQLTTGTVPDARFPATLPVLSGINLTNLNGSNIASGTVADARLTANVTLGGNSFTGTGLMARQTSPTFITPILGVASATSLDLGSAGYLRWNGASDSGIIAADAGAQQTGNVVKIVDASNRGWLWTGRMEIGNDPSYTPGSAPVGGGNYLHNIRSVMQVTGNPNTFDKWEGVTSWVNINGLNQSTAGTQDAYAYNGEAGITDANTFNFFTIYGAHMTAYVNGSGNILDGLIGVMGKSFPFGSGTIAKHRGAQGWAASQTGATGTSTLAQGLYGIISNVSGYTMTTAIAVDGLIDVNAGSIGTLAVIRARAETTGAGTVTGNRTGVLIEDQGVGAVSGTIRNLWSRGTARINEIEGDLLAKTLTTGTGGSTAGFVGLAQGTAQSISTNTVGLMAPTSVTGYNIVFPSAAWTGLLNFVNAANVVTASNANANDVSAPVFAADAGGSDTYTATLAPAPAAYVTGSHYRFKANTANTGAATINLNSLGAKTIKKVAGGITTDLADNDIRSGQWVDLIYDGTNMQMQSTLGNAPAGAGTVTTTGSPASPQLARFSGASSITTAIVDDVSTPVFCSDAGGSDTYTCTLAPAPAGYTTGVRYRFKANTANTGTASINFNSLGAKTIKKVAGGITTDLADNDIQAGQWIDLTYDGTNMQMGSQLGNAAGGSGVGTFYNVQNNGNGVVASSTYAWYVMGLSQNTVSANFKYVQTAIPAACTVRNLYVRGGDGAQPASGSLVVTIMKNNATTAVTVTFPANQAAQSLISDTTHTASFAAGDLIHLQFQNNATAASTAIDSVSFQCN